MDLLQLAQYGILSLIVSYCGPLTNCSQCIPVYRCRPPIVSYVIISKVIKALEQTFSCGAPSQTMAHIMNNYSRQTTVNAQNILGFIRDKGLYHLL